MYDILEDNSKSNNLKNVPILLKEGQLKRLIRTLRKAVVFDENRYENKYLVGSQPSWQL